MPYPNSTEFHLLSDIVARCGLAAVALALADITIHTEARTELGVYTGAELAVRATALLSAHDQIMDCDRIAVAAVRRQITADEYRALRLGIGSAELV